MFPIYVKNKFFLVGLLGLALALMIVGPITFLHLCTNLVWWEILVVYAVLSVQAMVGLFLLDSVWQTFEIRNEEAAEK
ncbi:MAG: hypothetical protein Q8K68_08455 [Nitrospirota bacterium]|nr:hypothetical protein [Nitrospirota bacterium]